MNLEFHKQVFQLAESLLESANKEHARSFGEGYELLKQLCEQSEGTPDNHPLQWEALADFTEDYVVARSYYEKSYGLALEIDADDHLSSVSLALALLSEDEGDVEQAYMLAKRASQHAVDISDQDLKDEVQVLLKHLTQ